MNSTRAPSPPLTTSRPKTSSSSISSIHAANNSPSPASMLPGSSRPRGATPSASRSSLKAVEGDRPTRPSSKDSLKQKMAKKADEVPRPSKADEARHFASTREQDIPANPTQQLKVLKTEFDSLRSHLTCKICDRLLYQPYTIACGHTYCYSCLCTWFVSNKSHKTCPDCRTVVTQAPAPAYVIRDMTTVFIGRAELLPAGETTEQHAKWQKEEADAVQQDKDNTHPRVGGLFKGCFNPSPPRGPSLQVVRDQEDGVERCPVCTWELEEHECVQCGLFFDDNGELTWTSSFTGFSDMDEMSERDMSGEDLDAEMDLEDADYDGYGGAPDGWQDYFPDDGNFMMRRFLEHGIPPQAAYARRRPMTHSEAGSRRSYTQSVVSDMYGDEMDTVEEEDEDGVDGDSSMNDFIEDDEDAESTSSPSASSGAGQTPQPSSARARPPQGRSRRVVESETSSTISSVLEEEEEDEEDQGPIRRGQRHRAQTRILNRANGSREPSGPSSSTSTDVSIDELDEDTQALLQAEGWMLQHNGHDDVGEDDDDSDGGRTTVGWDATAISNDRVRMGGSLTPTTDRPRPNAPIRPPSRVGNPLRRRSSVLSSSTVNYEDGEADDDDSDLDQDGDITMAMNSLRSRRSRAQLRNAAAFTSFNSRFVNPGLPQGDPIDLDADDNSDNSQSGNQRRANRQEYNPRISRLFADHQRTLQELQRGGPLLDLERSTTPIARPRTANRNRPSPAQSFSPFIPPAPARLRTPQMNNSSNAAINMRGPLSPPRRAAVSQSLSETINPGTGPSAERAPSVSSASNDSVILTPGTSTPSSQRSSGTISEASIGAVADMIDRPPSRVAARPPSATGRRNPANFPPVYPAIPHTNVGLNIQGRIFPHQALGNPWGAFVRSRSSRQVLRDQSSTATLRAASSRANIREGVTSPQGVRPQPSRIDLRPQPSRRRLNNQASTRTLRASDHARPPQSPVTNTTSVAQPASRPSRLTPEETVARARELVNNRMLALGQPGSATTRNNPFVRRPSNPSEFPITAGSGVAPHHARSNSNESNNSANSSHTATMTPSSPGLTRRRSNRHIAANPPGVLPPTHGTYHPPATAYTNNYLRSRQNPMHNGGSVFDLPLDANARGMSPMLATSLI